MKGITTSTDNQEEKMLLLGFQESFQYRSPPPPPPPLCAIVLKLKAYGITGHVSLFYQIIAKRVQVNEDYRGGKRHSPRE